MMSPTLMVFVFSLTAAILLFFSDDFQKIAKKIFSRLPGLGITLALAFASMIVIIFQEHLWVLLASLRLGFRTLEDILAGYLSKVEFAQEIVRVILLWCVAFIPMVLTLFLSKKHIILQSRELLYRVAIYSWVIVAVLFASIQI